jgi:hypothetical protein
MCSGCVRITDESVSLEVPRSESLIDRVFVLCYVCDVRECGTPGGRDKDTALRTPSCTEGVGVDLSYSTGAMGLTSTDRDGWGRTTVFPLR